MKRVLIISYYWPPTGGSGVQRWVKFAKYLPSEGWQPVIYTPLNPEQLVVDESLADEVPPQAEVIKRKIIEPYSIYRFLTGGKGGSKGTDEVNVVNSGKKTFMQRLSMAVRGNFFIPDPRCLWVRPSVRFLKKYLKEHPVDIIVSTGPPQSMHLIGRRLALATGLPWIADFRDPWTKIFYFKHLSLSAWSRRKHGKLEKQVLDDASAVVSVTPLVQAEFRAMTSTPVELITNGYDEDDFRPAGKPEPGNGDLAGGSTDAHCNNGPGIGNSAEGSDDRQFVLTHTGLFAADGNPETLWKVLSDKCLNNGLFKQNLRIRLVGKTDRQVIESIHQAGLSENLADLGYLPHDEAVREQRKATVLMLPLRKEPEYKAVLPGKVFEYLASGRPILGIGQPDGAMASLFASCGAGIVADWDDKEAVSEFINSCWAKFSAGLPLCGAQDVSQYSRRNLTRKYAALMDGLIGWNGII